MTISSTTAVTRTNTNGVTHTFNFGHPFQDPDDLRVWLVTISDWSIALQTRDTHYTVSNNGNEDEVGGTITFINHLAVATAPATGKVAVILRKPDAVQDYNPGSVYEAAQGEAALDRIYQMLQYLQLRSDRSIHLNDAYADATVEIPDAAARASKALVFDSSGNLTVGESGATVLADSLAAQAAAEAAAIVAVAQASAATTAASASATARDLAQDWASKVNGIVNGQDFSAKAWAIGGSDVSVTANRGAAKEWATKTNALVDTDEGSAKAYAVGGTGVSTTSGRGAAKEWATKVTGAVDTAEYSSKAYAVGGTGVTAGHGAAKEWAGKTDGAVNGEGDQFSAKAWALGGTSVSATAARGAAKEWATKTDGNVDTADASAKAWSVGGTGVTDVAARGAAKEWATKAFNSTVDTSEYSAKHYATVAANEAANAAAVSENPALTFMFDSATGDADPGDGEFRLNHATYASATFAYIDNLDHFGNAMTGWLDAMDDANTLSKGILMFRDVTDPLAFAIYRVNGTVLTASTYRKVPLTVVASGTNAFSGLISVMFIPGIDFPSTIPIGFTMQGALIISSDNPYLQLTDTDTNADVYFGANTATGSAQYFADYAGTAANSDHQWFVDNSSTVRMNLSASGLQMQTSGARINAFLDEDNMASDSAVAVPTQQSVKAYVDTQLNAHLNDTVDAHDASAISIVDTSDYFTGTQLEAVLAEVGAYMVAYNSAIVLKGTWAANAGTFPGSSVAQAGWTYIVSVGGTVDSQVFVVGDRITAIVDNASTSTFAANWFKEDYTDLVSSVAGKTGAVTIQVADITDMSANGRSLTSAADYSAMRTLLSLVPNTNFYAPAGTDVAIADGGTGASTAATGFDNLKQTATTTYAGVQELATDAEVRAATTGALSVTAAHLETAAATVALTDAAPVAVDWDTGVNFTLTVTANRQIGNPTNGQPGTYRTILVQGNDGTDRTITFGNQFGGDIPGLTDCDNVKKYLLTIYCKTSTQFIVTAINGSDA